MARRELDVQTREIVGKKVAQLRRSGYLPGNVYGHGLDSVAVQISSDDLEHTLKAAVANEVIDLKIAGERAARPVVIQKVQRHPLTSGVLHAEFYQVSLRERMRADVPLVVVGKSEGIDTYNGVLVHALEALHVEALPLDLPSRIEVDITPLRHLEDTIHVRDLVVPQGVSVLVDEDAVVVKVASPRVSTEEGEEAPVPGAVSEEAPVSSAEEETASEAGSESASEA
jgi:large subunit ribosomal protein L25